ncbi:MAG: hypothetical protein ACREJ3_09470 [Polyangiaceae bacterium]
MPSTKAEIARELAKHHFVIEDGMESIFIMRAGLDDPREPIKLLEVNANTFPTGSIEPIPFSTTDDVPYVTEIAEISPDEFAQLKDGKLVLPPGWALEDAEAMTRPRAA